MITIRRRVGAVIAAAATLAVGTSAADANAATTPRFALPAGLWAGGLPALTAPPFAPGICGTAASDLQGPAGGAETRICMGSGLVFVGPMIGQIASVIGPTVIGPVNIGTSAVSAGNVAIAP